MICEAGAQLVVQQTQIASNQAQAALVFAQHQAARYEYLEQTRAEEANAF